MNENNTNFLGNEELTMAEYYKYDLIKTMVVSVILGIVFTIIFHVQTGESVGFLTIYIFLIATVLMGGVPSAWKMISKVIPGVTLLGILIKLMGSLMFGGLALAIVIVKDIIMMFSAKRMEN